MEIYEVLCNGVAEARLFRFSSIHEAKKEAERVCQEFHVEARVVLVIGTFVPEARWISNEVPGYAEQQR